MELSNEYIKKYNMIKNNEIKNKIKTYGNKTKYKTTPYNIDSRYRNIKPKNILDTNITILKNNPLQFTNNSNILKINTPNHNFKVKDRIILENVEGFNMVLTNNIYLQYNFKYAIININNINLVKSTINKQKIILEPLEKLGRYFGSISTNNFVGPKEIIFMEDIDFIPNEIYTELKVTETELKNNYIFFELPFIYTSEQIIDEGIKFTNFYNINKMFRFKLDSIASINIGYINANYPITYNRFNGFHEITSIDNDNIYIEMKLTANNNVISGGSNIKIAKIVKSLEGFVESNNYIINLKKNFTNVVRIELISSEFFFLDNLIKSSGSDKNNKLYWQHLDDGDTTYSIDIVEGNYNPDNLIDEITNSMNNVERLGSTDENKIYNVFDIKLNSDTNLVQFIAYKFEFLPNSLTINIIEINGNEYYEVTVKHKNNLVELNDTISIRGARNIGKVPNSVINSDHIVYAVNTRISTYSFILPPFKALGVDNVIGDGGDAISIKTRAKVRFLFDRSDTIGNILGFKNVGEENSITEFQHIVSNQDDYVFPNIFDFVGNVNINNNILNLTGPELYIMMHLNNYESIISNSPQGSCFAKILLTGSPGDAIFNTYINYPVEFDIPIKSLNQFNISFTFADGTKPNFNNLNHSFTLLITEELFSNNSIGKNSNNV